MIYKLIVILAVFSAACAQMLLKKAATIKYPSVIRQYLNPWVIGGYSIMGVMMLVNIFAMNKGVQLKEVGIMESLSYLFVPMMSFVLFQEKLTLLKICSIGVVICGVIIFFI